MSTTLYLAGGLFVVLLLAVLAVPAVRNFRGEEAVSRRRSEPPAGHSLCFGICRHGEPISNERAR